MVVSWRVSALVLLGAVPLIAAPSVGFVWCWAGGCLVLGALDALTGGGRPDQGRRDEHVRPHHH